MNEPNEQTSLSLAVRNRGQYLLACGVIASLLMFVNVPIFIVFFFGVFAYFMAKLFASGSKMRTRAIFEFYLSANEVLKKDDRHWYGFEINEIIGRGERIVKDMRNTPPLVHYALGALYNKVGDHSSAARHLSFVAENPESFEGSIVYPSTELRSYVNVLRKIEREPADAPLTSAAIRSLERGRKLKADRLLAESRSIVEKAKPETAHAERLEAVHGGVASHGLSVVNENVEHVEENDPRPVKPVSVTALPDENRRKPRKKDPERKPIVEVLHEIYDRNIQ